ncbi:MAG: DMT family transporter [Planctomycetes bacterium]|nr:DMT family transporter [Planctomycetota bacterium]
MSPARRATILLFATTILWGSSFFTMAWGIEGIARRIAPAAAPAAYLCLRFLAAFVLQGLVFPRALGGLNRRVVGAGVVLALPFFAGMLLQSMAISSESSTVSAFLTSLFVVVTPLLGWLFFRERLVPITLLGAAVSLAGVYVLSNPSGGLGRRELLTLACAVAFALQIQMTNVITRNHPPEAISLVQFGATALFSGIAAFAMGASPAGMLRSLGDPPVAWTVLYTAVACSVVAMGVLNRYQRDLPATRASVLYMIEPVFAALFALIFTGEAMTARKWMGGAIILGGNLLCELIGRRAREKETT